MSRLYEKDLNAAARPAQSRRMRRIISDENGEGCGGRKVVAVVDKLTSKAGFFKLKIRPAIPASPIDAHGPRSCAERQRRGPERNVVRASANTFLLQLNN